MKEINNCICGLPASLGVYFTHKNTGKIRYCIICYGGKHGKKLQYFNTSDEAIDNWNKINKIIK